MFEYLSGYINKIKLLFCVPSACYYSIAPVLITESFPIRLRCTSLAGSTPLVLLYLTNHSHGIHHLPAYYSMGSCILGLIGLQMLSFNKTTQREMGKALYCH